MRFWIGPADLEATLPLERPLGVPQAFFTGRMEVMRSVRRLLSMPQ